MPTLPTWLPASLVMLSAVIGALYVMLSAIATFATAFWPQSTTAHYLAAAVLDLAKIRSMLAGFLPGSVAKVAAVTTLAMTMIGCSLFGTPSSPGWTYVDEACVVAISIAGGSPADAAGVCGSTESVAQQIVAWFQASKGDAGPAPAPSPAAVEALAKYRAAKAAHTIDAGGQ